MVPVSSIALVVTSLAVLVFSQAIIDLTPAEYAAKYSIKQVGPLNNEKASSVFRTANYSCFRCNRFTGGGKACPETEMQKENSNVDPEPFGSLIVRNCEVCLKVKTTQYYRNRNHITNKFKVQETKHFESRYVISRTCIEDKKDARLTNGCIIDSSHGGTVERCYCQGDLCNSGMPVMASLLTLVSIIAVWL